MHCDTASGDLLSVLVVGPVVLAHIFKGPASKTRKRKQTLNDVRREDGVGPGEQVEYCRTTLAFAICVSMLIEDKPAK